MCRVNPEFAALIPPLTPEERAGLERSILEEGVREPIVTWRGWIVDGHNRHEIATAHGLDFETVEYDFEDEDAAKEWMILNQFARRNINAYQRSVLALQLKEVIAARAKEKQRESGGAVPQKSAKPPIDTRDEIAAFAGVSHDTISKVEHIERKATDELKAQVRSGETSINAAYTKLRQDEREAQREEKREENAEQVAELDNPLDAMGLFATIVVDPPWDWGDEGDVNQMGRAKPDYATMPISELEELPVGRIAAEDAHLYLWVTNRSLPKAFRLMEAWGFRYITCITWAKPSFGMGNYFRGQTEQVLFGVRGSLPLKRKDASTLFTAARGQGGHSSKPLEFYGFVESCSPGPYIDVFSRMERDGWSTWGQGS